MFPSPQEEVPSIQPTNKTAVIFVPAISLFLCRNGEIVDYILYHSVGNDDDRPPGYNNAYITVPEKESGERALS
jgi:hypothetical protein